MSNVTVDLDSPLAVESSLENEIQQNVGDDRPGSVTATVAVDPDGPSPSKRHADTDGPVKTSGIDEWLRAESKGRTSAPSAVDTVLETLKSRWVIAAVVACVVVLLGIWVMSDGGETSAEPTVSPATWQGGVLPVSPEAGPAVFTVDESSGFARTPLGASLAAAHLAARTAAHSGPKSFQPTIESSTVGDKAALLANRNTRYEELAKQTGTTDGDWIRAASNEIVGWSAAGWNETDPIAHLLIRNAADDSLVDLEIPLHWDDAAGDWRLETVIDFDFELTPDDSTFTSFFPSTTKES